MSYIKLIILFSSIMSGKLHYQILWSWDESE